MLASTDATRAVLSDTFAAFGAVCSELLAGVRQPTTRQDQARHSGSISASPTACPLRGYGRVGTQNDRLSEALKAYGHGQCTVMAYKVMAYIAI